MKAFEEFQQFRKILCVCPGCENIVRVSDLKLKIKGGAIRTWLDEYEEKCKAMDQKEEKFEEIVGRLREVSVTKGRKEAEVAFNKAINPMFKLLKLDPYDIKPILNPVDFLVFKNMNKKEVVDDIVFLSETCKNPLLNDLRAQVKSVIKKEKYDWQVARVGKKGEIELE